MLYFFFYRGSNIIIALPSIVTAIVVTLTDDSEKKRNIVIAIVGRAITIEKSNKKRTTPKIKQRKLRRFSHQVKIISCISK